VGQQTVQEINAVQRQVVRADDIPERRRRYLVRWESMKAERSRHWETWKKITDFIIPERGRFLFSDHNKPKETSRILDNTPTRMLRICAAGLAAGCTPRLRPWFNLTLHDPDLSRWGPVKKYLFEYNRRMRQVFELSGLYRALTMGNYPDLAAYGLGTSLMEEHPTKIMRFIPFSMGTYGLAQDGEYRVNTLIYEEPWTVGELVEHFGWENCSPSVKVAWNGNYMEQYVSVLRVIEPNAEFIPGPSMRYGRWGSAYMEIGGLNSSSGALAQPSTDPAVGFLQEGKYNENPIMCFRWHTAAKDVYPTGPGHDALPDSRQLMKVQSRKLLGLDKGLNPSLMMPETMRVSRVQALPGDAVYLPAGVKADDVKPTQIIDPRWMEFAQRETSEDQQRIAAAFFADLLRRLTDRPEGAGKQPETAEWIVQAKQEDMQQMGPMLENTFETLSNLIERTSAIMERRHIAPVPPREIQGMELKVEFISILAQAMKLMYTQGKERFVAFTGQLASIAAAHGQEGPAQVLDNVNLDSLHRSYADDLGLDPDVLNDEETVQQQRQARAQASQEQAQRQAVLDAAEAAKSLGKTPLGEDTLLSRMVGPTPSVQ
jgi:hypothetical protein